MTSLADLSRTLTALARSRRPEDRERLLAALGAFCDGADGADACRRPQVQALLCEVLLSLIGDAERDIRARLAERLAEAAWAPHQLISTLALDDIDIARPIIARSPLLAEPDLIRVLVQATLEHQIEVARRAGIGPAVVDAILDQDRPEVLAALAANDTAHVEPRAMIRLVGGARTAPGLRAPLARHPRLRPEMAGMLYGWVGETLRESLTARFGLDPHALQAAMTAAVRDAREGVAPPPPTRADREELERRLLAKLDAAGQLRPGYLLRALREGRLDLFVGALSTLGGLPVGLVRQAVDRDQPDRLALACTAVGLDRSVFPTVLGLVRGLNAGRPLGDEHGAAAVTAALTRQTPQGARAALLSLAADEAALSA